MFYKTIVYDEEGGNGEDNDEYIEENYVIEDE
jgi:hypothetical protein